MPSKSSCQEDIEDLGGRLEICREVQGYHYGMREFGESAEWGKVCGRIEDRLKSAFKRCER